MPTSACSNSTALSKSYNRINHSVAKSLSEQVEEMDGSQTSPLLSGLEDQCEEDRKVERKPTGGWRSAIYIIGVEVAERFAYYGISANLIMYLTIVLNESTVSAAKKVNTWSGVAALLPLLGAFIADSYLGRYRTILISSLIYLLGLSLLTMSVAMVIPLQVRELLFFISLYMVGIGQGGHKPCVQAFGADQFDEDSAEGRKAKNSFFNWWYFGICSSAGAGTLIVTNIQDNVGWAIGFGIPTIAMVFALFLFLFGSNTYTHIVPSGQSPLTGVPKVIVAAARKWHLPSRNDNPDEGGCVPVAKEVISQTNQFKFLDKATIVDDLDASCCQNSWRLCTQAQVEETKQIMRLVPIWACCLMFAVVFAQPGTFFTKQCSTMNRKIWSSFEVSPASLLVSSSLTIVAFVPIYDRILVPTTRRLTGIPSGLMTLRRIGIGIFLSVTSMVVAALVEMRRLKIAREYGPFDHPNATVPMSVWWLLPQYIIYGLADVFTMVGLQEFFYDQMPDGMRSIGAAAYLSIVGTGSFLSSVIISLIQGIKPEWLTNDLNNSHLDYYYWLLAGLSALWLCFYICAAKRFVYKQTYYGLP
ncbi:protein NRT1/ PTR FAMILY 5.10-like [Magnolia sinica]|uniref:protein NRT1/ PTR FAMILY 5.10-like n=1 Tax=Magnolia sinica TaxID=86752 RepID=UPI00265B0671|nr:protein NRT1/ PTR FAMILY 5.10-like [Magnolia sinica]